ncbi:prepilin-type N-terminal cleavage/methylation domain-containing protein, partial [PVC group bacterium]|nr:prepilin-type N-terminal cleavage/methylation domain-containing protein [PVC group bacterium]
MNQKISMNCESRRSNNGFTLIELITVIAIIAIVAGLLLSGISKGRAFGVKASCVMQLSKIELMLRMYAADWRDTYPF